MDTCLVDSPSAWALSPLVVKLLGSNRYSGQAEVLELGRVGAVSVPRLAGQLDQPIRLVLSRRTGQPDRRRPPENCNDEGEMLTFRVLCSRQSFERSGMIYS